MQHPLALCLVLGLCSCESAPRFAPLLIETSRPSRSLPAEQWTSTSQPTGLLPEVSAPSFTCLKVGPNGETTLPPLRSGQSVETYQDALVCLVVLSASEDYERLLVQLRAGQETHLVMEGSLASKGKEQLIWIPGRQWRELTTGQKLFSLEVVFPCDEDEEGMGCELVLSQSFTASPLPLETRTEPKSVKGPGPKVGPLQCATEDTFGKWGEPLAADGILTESFFCKLSVENPGENKLENVSLELRGGTSKGNVKPLASQLFATLGPKEEVSYLFHVSVDLPQSGAYVLSGAAGRNATERNSSQRVLSLKTQPPASQPSSQPTR